MRTEKRNVVCDGGAIDYLLEWKTVKNLNLRIRWDGIVHVSANPDVPVETVDMFVAGKEKAIRSAQHVFCEATRYAAHPKQYVSGETFYLLGRGVRLKVQRCLSECVFVDGVYLYLYVKDPSDIVRKRRLVTHYLDRLCRTVFGDVLSGFYPVFQKYGVPMPTLRIRSMDTLWGSCSFKRGTLTLNKRLLEAPRNGIEYVVTHELCHLLHPNHSADFYRFLTMLMPDWKERKTALDRSATIGV